MTMVTYAVDAKELKSVTLRFRAHHEAYVPVIHLTLNAVYGVDLYDTDFHFLFNNVATS